MIGLAYGIPVAVAAQLIKTWIDARFASRNSRDLPHYWVRGDSGFQNFALAKWEIRTVYAQKVLLLIDGSEFLLIARSRDDFPIRVPYSEVQKVTTEAFQSKSVGGRGVRVHLKSGGSFCVRAELNWLPPLFAPKSVTLDLAEDLVGSIKRFKSRTSNP